MRNVFGVRPTNRDRLRELRRQDRAQVFKMIVERANNTETQTKEEHSLLRRGTDGLPLGGAGYRVCPISAQQALGGIGNTTT